MLPVSLLLACLVNALERKSDEMSSEKFYVLYERRAAAYVMLFSNITMFTACATAARSKKDGKLAIITYIFAEFRTFLLYFFVFLSFSERERAHIKHVKVKREKVR